MQASPIPEFKDIHWRWIGYIASLFVLAALVFAFVREVELKQDVPCEIVSPSEVKIRGMSGLVASVLVHPSDHVEPGTPLFQLQHDLSLSADGRRRQLFDETMRDDQLRANDEAYRERRAQLLAQRDAMRATESSRRAERDALQAQIAENRQIVTETQRRSARLDAVSDYVTADKIEQARVDTLQAQATVSQGMARQRQLDGEIGVAASTQTQLDAQLREIEARHDSDAQDIRNRYEQARRDTTVSAPKAGVVTFSNLVAGRTLDPADVALVIATPGTGALKAALRIPSRRRGFVREGQTVRLKFDAYPYARFGTYAARIESISDTTIGAAETPPGPDKKASNEGDTYLAWASLPGHAFHSEGRDFAILPGMRATASIVVERRTIAEWVLAPLFSALRS
ncbi:HlyD family efflux transporter periplasmic adaptor subunit [Caballeronia sp. BR00000012568055]|uniref:HlyD family efflux transporter periplasmic adaptor subunit n=1 Tax=Caballeronia sp. BR00000012568055 TaxID=2918761 RepID=UPI0023F84684|nr:HlyD family efflux transporter periplasmic adaptor subunit [Caballeronia sp. BR00000012568055]